MTGALPALGEILREAGQRARHIRAHQFHVETKPDGSLVTDADRAVETLLREHLPQLAPDTTVWGEEFGIDPVGPNGRWAVDPIDGTSNFAFGGPLWGVSAALVVGDDIPLAGIYLPDLEEMYLGDSVSAWLNERRLDPIPPGPIQPSQLVAYGTWVSHGYGPLLPGQMRLSGAFVIDGAFTATQRVRATVAARERLYDAAACIALIRALDGEVVYTDGEPFDVSEVDNGERIPGPWIMGPRETGLRFDR
jgi:myo-inositol-1(or 4)-monophosphatase